MLKTGQGEQIIRFKVHNKRIRIIKSEMKEIRATKIKNGNNSKMT